MKKRLMRMLCILQAMLILTGLCGISVSAENEEWKKVEGYNFIDASGGDLGRVISSINTASGRKTQLWNFNWIDIPVTMENEGTYDVYVRVSANKGDGATCNFYVDCNKLLSKSFNVPGGYDDFVVVEMGKLYLKKGENIIRIGNENQNICIDYIQIGKKPRPKDAKTEGAYRNTYIPAVLEAEHFDMGKDGSYSNDGRNSGDPLFRPYDVMDIYVDTALASGYYLGLGGGEFASYTFNAEFGDMYTLKMAYNGSDNVQIFMDGILLSEQILPATKKFEEVTLGSLWIDKGQHTIKIKIDGGLPIDYLKLDRSESEPLVTDGEEGQKEEGTAKKESVVWRELYVSENGSDENTGDRENPFKTLKRAADEIAQISGEMKGDITVNIDPGYYFMDETLELTNAHGGKNGYQIIFKSTDANDRPIISGGVKIEGWEKTENKIWKAKAEDVEQAITMSVNGIMAQRARSKYLYNMSEYYNDPKTEWERDGYKMLGPVPEFKYPENVELVTNFLWITHRIPLADVRETEVEGEYIIEADSPYFQTHFAHWSAGSYPDYAKTYAFENDMVLLDQPGEFYFDPYEKMMYYYPYNEEDMTTAETYVPVTDKLITVKGESKDNKVENISFEGLDFRYGAWSGLAKQGISVLQSNNIYHWDGEKCIEIRVPAQIEIDFANGIDIDDCNFEGMEGGAVKMENYVTNASVTGSTFHDIAGSAVSVDNPVIAESETSGRCSGITITDNLMIRMGIQLIAPAAVMCYYTADTKIMYNDIRQVSYSAISIGWGWGQNSPACRNNEIAYNWLTDNMKGVHDGASVYTLGSMPETTIHDNYVADSGDHRGGLYNDNGSANIKTYHNVSEQNNPDDYYTLINSGSYNCEFTDNFCNSTGSIIVEGNNVHDNTFVPFGSEWPQEALDIIAAAGTRTNREKAEDLLLPEWHEDMRDAYDNGSFLMSALENDNIIWSHEFMEGGEGIAYHMTREGHKIGVRDETAADLFNSATVPGGHDLGLMPGEWFNYEIEIKESGNYSFYYYTQNNQTGGIDADFDLYIDGELVIDDPYLRPTPDPNSYALNKADGVYLEAGKHIVKFESTGCYFGVTYFLFVPEGDALNALFDEGVLEEQKYRKKFADMVNHWAKTEVEEMANMGYLNGVGEDKFAPDNTLSLYQCLWIALRICGRDSGEGWQSEAYDLGLISDVNIADRNISREETAEILMKVYLDKIGSYKIEIGADSFSDIEEVDMKYANAVIGANSVGLFKGDTNGNFNPKSALTRAEAATIFYRLLNI